jgi:two-component system, chemotaxis family, protein-glutamate methylesterase/glutaminase
MLRVLIVDDDADTRETVYSLLDLLGDDQPYEGILAADGHQALDHLHATTDATVVVFDLYMPVMDGQQFLLHALADPALAARCAFICITASPQRLSGDAPALLAAHGIPLITKPFDIDVLLDAVRQAAGGLSSV